MTVSDSASGDDDENDTKNESGNTDESSDRSESSISDENDTKNESDITDENDENREDGSNAEADNNGEVPVPNPCDVSAAQMLNDKSRRHEFFFQVDAAPIETENNGNLLVFCSYYLRSFEDTEISYVCVEEIVVWLIEEESREIYQEIHYTYPPRYLDRTINFYCSPDITSMKYSKVVDINTDGYKDVIIFRDAIRFSLSCVAFVWDKKVERLVYEPSFGEISHPTMSTKEEGIILGRTTGNTPTFSKYKYEDGRIVLIADLHITSSHIDYEGTQERLYHETRYDNGEIVSDQKYVIKDCIDFEYWYENPGWGNPSMAPAYWS